MLSRTGRRAAVLAVAAALVLPVLPATPATAADTGPCPLISCTRSSLPAYATVIAAVTPPRADALDLYRSLIPAPYSMPATPLVGLSMTRLQSPGYGLPPLIDLYGGYAEGMLAIRVRYGTAEGWYPLDQPVNNLLVWGAGQAVGLPKYLADVRLSRQGTTGYQIRAGVLGRTTQAMTYATGLPRVPDAAEVATLREWTTNALPYYTLVPPLTGPQAERVSFDTRPFAFFPPLPEPSLGTVTIQVDQSGERYAGLFSPQQTLVGMLWIAEGDITITSRRLT